MYKYVITIRLKEMPENGKNIYKRWISANNRIQAIIEANTLNKYFNGDIVSIRLINNTP